MESIDIRAKNGYLPKPNKINEIAIASATFLLLIAIPFGIVLGAYKLAKSGITFAAVFSRLEAKTQQLKSKISDISIQLQKNLKTNKINPDGGEQTAN